MIGCLRSLSTSAPIQKHGDDHLCNNCIGASQGAVGPFEGCISDANQEEGACTNVQILISPFFRPRLTYIVPIRKERKNCSHKAHLVRFTRGGKSDLNQT